MLRNAALRTELENSRSTATASRLVPAVAEARDVSGTCCHRQEIPASQFSRQYHRLQLDVTITFGPTSEDLLSAHVRPRSNCNPCCG